MRVPQVFEYRADLFWIKAFEDGAPSGLIELPVGPDGPEGRGDFVAGLVLGQARPVGCQGRIGVQGVFTQNVGIALEPKTDLLWGSPGLLQLLDGLVAASPLVVVSYVSIKLYEGIPD